jgi:hypothetical protein
MLLRANISSWDVSYPGFCWATEIALQPDPVENIEIPHHKTVNGTLFIRSIPPMCTHSAIYSRSAAELILNNWKPLFGGIDVIYKNIMCAYGECTCL